jgi:metal-responsive CopG/Arc/MetJ family transcriptional regulator
MADEETKQFVNAEMPKELVEKLDAMRDADKLAGSGDQTRSGFIRMLIRQEFQRRQGLLVPAKIIQASPVAKTAIKKVTAKRKVAGSPATIPA